MRGSTLDILLHDFQLFNFFFAEGLITLIEIQAHANSVIVLCDGVKSEFMACARQSDSELVLLSQLDATAGGPSRRSGRTASAAIGWPGAAPWAAWALMQSVLMHWKRHGQAGVAAGPAPDVCHQPPGKQFTNTTTLHTIASTLVALLSRQLASLNEVIGSSPEIIHLFDFVKNCKYTFEPVYTMYEYL